MSKYVTTYIGKHVYKDEGIPTLKDVAVSLCRTPMFAGATKIFYSVAHHCLGVAELMPEHKIYGLFHEVEVAVVGDCPGPMKTPEQKKIEERIRRDFISSQGLPEITTEIQKMVEKADWLDQGASARALEHLDATKVWPYHPDMEHAEKIVWGIHTRFHPSYQLYPDSPLVKEFIDLADRLKREELGG